jgi:hypothetical protein
MEEFSILEMRTIEQMVLIFQLRSRVNSFSTTNRNRSVSRKSKGVKPFLSIVIQNINAFSASFCGGPDCQ